jgi:hypothetical protein
MTVLAQTFEASAPAEDSVRPGTRSTLGPSVAIDLLLRRPTAFLDHLHRCEDPVPLIRLLLLTTAGTSGALGAALGAWRGGSTILAGAVKLPVLELIMATLCAPALSAMKAAVYGATDFRRDIALILAALCFATLVGAGLAPVMLLAAVRELDACRTMVILLYISAIAGVMGLSVLIPGIASAEDSLGRTIVGTITVLLVSAIGTQAVWQWSGHLIDPGQVAADASRIIPAAGDLVIRHEARSSYDQMVRACRERGDCERLTRYKKTCSRPGDCDLTDSQLQAIQ